MERTERIVKEVTYLCETDEEFDAFYKLLSIREDADFICYQNQKKIISYEAVEC